MADAHRTVANPQSRSLFPHQIEALGQTGQRLYATMREEFEQAYTARNQWLKEHGPWDIIIDHGDMTGGWQQHGCAHPAAAALTQSTHDDLAEIADVEVACGNHDTGYVTGAHGRGINPDSVRTLEQIFRRLTWSRKVGNRLLLGVCSPIAQYAGGDPYLLQMKCKQELYVRRALNDHPGAWVLFTHSPQVASHLVALQPHLHRMEHMFYGDKHSIMAGRFLKALASTYLLGWAPSTCLKKATIVPSTAPVWWRGYALLTFELGETITTQHVLLPRPPESVDLPVSSLIRCLFWMRPRVRTMLKKLNSP